MMRDRDIAGSEPASTLELVRALPLMNVFNVLTGTGIVIDARTTKIHLASHNGSEDPLDGGHDPEPDFIRSIGCT